MPWFGNTTWPVLTRLVVLRCQRHRLLLYDYIHPVRVYGIQRSIGLHGHGYSELGFCTSCFFHYRYFWSTQPAAIHLPVPRCFFVLDWLQLLDQADPAFKNCHGHSGNVSFRGLLLAWFRTCTVHLLRRSIPTSYPRSRDVVRHGNDVVFQLHPGTYMASATNSLQTARGVCILCDLVFDRLGSCTAVCTGNKG